MYMEEVITNMLWKLKVLLSLHVCDRSAALRCTSNQIKVTTAPYQYRVNSSGEENRIDE